MKNIGKIKASIISGIIAFVILVGLVLTFVPMQIGSKDYESIISSIALSKDLGESISAEYMIDGEYSDKEIESAIKLMTEISNEYGFKSVSVYKKGTNKIRLDINSTVLESDKSSAESFLNTLASGKLTFKNKNSAGATPETEPELILIDASKHIDKIEKINYKTSGGLQISFTKEGKELYTSAAGEPLYMFVGSKAWPGENSQNEIAANNDPSSTQMTLMFNSVDVVDSYYYVLRAGMLPISLDSDNVDIAYTNSSSASIVKLVLFIMAISIIVGLIALIIVRFRGFGIAFGASYIISLVIILFLLQAMNWVVMGASSIIALMILSLMNYVVITIISNSIKDNYNMGKSIETAVEDGYRKSTKVATILYVALFVIGLVFAICAPAEFKAIGTIFALGSALTGVSVIFLSRVFASLIYSINGKPEVFGLNSREEA